MASYITRKGSPFYWLKLKDAQTGIWKQVHSGVRIDAADGLRKVKIKVLEAEMKELMNSPTQEKQEGLRGWGWVAGFFVQHYRNEKSLVRAKNAWSALAVFLELQHIAGAGDVTHMHGHEYVQWRQNPPAGSVRARGRNTALTEIKILSVVVQEAVRRGMAASNPLFRLGIKRTPVKHKPAITAEEQERIEEALKSAPQWMQDQWLLAMRHACRLREVQVPLIPERLDLARGVIVFCGKKDKLHAMPLHPDCVPIVERRMAEGAEFLVDVPPLPSRAWRKFFDGLGLRHISFHSTRVSVITRLAQKGVPEAVTMRYVGHASLTVHRAYQQLRLRTCSTLVGCCDDSSTATE